MSKSKFDLKQVSQHIPPADEARKLPPVHLWKPDFCGDMDMRITRDGRWIHEGGEIKRPAMVTMFSTILWREKDSYFLVTPVEKVGIQVDDVPFQFVHLDVKQGSDGQELVFTTVTDDVVTAGAEHPLRIEVDPATGEPSPYLMVRYGMEGRLSRNLYYELVALAVEQEGRYVVTSGGESFELG